MTPVFTAREHGYIGLKLSTNILAQNLFAITQMNEVWQNIIVASWCTKMGAGVALPSIAPRRILGKADLTAILSEADIYMYIMCVRYRSIVTLVRCVWQTV